MVLNTKLYRNHSYLWIITTESSVSGQENPKYFSHKIKFHYQKLVYDRNLYDLMIARIAQRSFCEIRELSRKYNRQKCASTADWTDWSRQCPRNQVLLLQLLPQVNPLLSLALCRLPSAPSLTSRVALCVG